MSRQPDFVARVIEIVESSPDLRAAEYAIRAEYAGDKPYVAAANPQRRTEILVGIESGRTVDELCKQHRVSRRTIERLRVTLRRNSDKLG